MADRMDPPFFGKSPILSEEELRALSGPLGRLKANRPRLRPRPPRLSNEEAERLRKLLMKNVTKYKNGGAVMSGRGNNFKGVR
tara:strand:+ start:156 stop:404 length:249 start_codon:yes stop_codon:yes gene_type:complete